MRGSPVDLELIACSQGLAAEEHAIHKQFSEFRVRGEWFRYEGALKAWILDLVRALSNEEIRSLQEEVRLLTKELERIDARIAKIAGASNRGIICAKDLGSREANAFDETYVNADYLSEDMIAHKEAATQ